MRYEAAASECKGNQKCLNAALNTLKVCPVFCGSGRQKACPKPKTGKTNFIGSSAAFSQSIEPF